MLPIQTYQQRWPFSPQFRYCEAPYLDCRRELTVNVTGQPYLILDWDGLTNKPRANIATQQGSQTVINRDYSTQNMDVEFLGDHNILLYVDLQVIHLFCFCQLNRWTDLRVNWVVWNGLNISLEFLLLSCRTDRLFRFSGRVTMHIWRSAPHCMVKPVVFVAHLTTGWTMIGIWEAGKSTWIWTSSLPSGWLEKRTPLKA